MGSRFKGWNLTDGTVAVKKNKPVTGANTLTRHALRILDLNGFECWRQNNGGVWDATKGVFRKNSSTPGVSDIIGYHRKTGRFLALEVKAGKDKLSPEQTLFLEKVKRSGGVAFVVRTTDVLENLPAILKMN